MLVYFFSLQKSPYCFLVHKKYISRGWVYTTQKTDCSASVILLPK